MIELKNRVVIVTGASRGIGAATAKFFARAGADVLIHYDKNGCGAKSVAEEITRSGKRAIIVQGDISDPQTSQNLVRVAIEHFGGVDVLVNNAGIWTYGESGAMAFEDWRRTMSVNLDGVFFATEAVVPFFKAHRGGKIINVASTAGQRGEAFHAHYAASKGGMLAYTRSLADELAQDGILVNAVAPGWVDTDLNAEIFSSAEERQKAVEGIPLKKIGTAEDVAGAILFLASDLANHITGATINVNGGSVKS